ncbi:LysR family transcriptional regulator [Kaistia geumhonensis]|uniref:DNA-binding transcriptional LysR family regulator n=1 Tax=Kaistia geumhonensis TaxID=410839 RepID=A0ABU0M0X1_9HYPH|nr:LysR family transcriptional regulator [Kaistia geumhonensis]MCX5480170.1 LysR family transcriptional regulator [Kaistia geumhonensis]MDQ0514601.1 DNA-binding transcriptional LysR family regulator [Kaistia geumhonensis]
MKDLDWNDLSLFLAVARDGGLGPAARRTGTSAATLGRRITALEKWLGLRLFDRGRLGYDLTEAGRTLLGQAEDVEQAVGAIQRWRANETSRRAVRISAGTWMTSFLAGHIAALHAPGDGWTIEFVTANARLDIARRAADIGIRNRRPDGIGLAGRRVATVCFAAYALAGQEGDDLPWIALAGEAAITPSAEWLARRPDARIGFRCTDARTLLDLARAGAGRAVLPCLIGDAEPALRRIGPPIAELASEQWLVTHHDDRHDPAVHAAAERISKLIRAHRPLFAGEQPQEM